MPATLRWTRREPGLYTSGPYTIARSLGVWHAEGPGWECRRDYLEDAKDECATEALRRIDDPEVEPVVGDAVVAAMTGEARRGRITAVFPAPGGTVYCVKLPRGRRLCLSRGEFTVVAT